MQPSMLMLLENQNIVKAFGWELLMYALDNIHFTQEGLMLFYDCGTMLHTHLPESPHRQ